MHRFGGSININDALTTNGCLECFYDYAKRRYPTINIGSHQEKTSGVVKVFTSVASS